MFRLGQFLGRRLERRVLSALEFRDARRIDVEPDGRVTLAELDGQRQPDIAEADDPDSKLVQVECHGHFSQFVCPEQGRKGV